MVHQVSTTWAQHLDQNVPDFAAVSLRRFLVDIGDFFAALARFAVQMHFLGWARIALTLPGLKG